MKQHNPMVRQWKLYVELYVIVDALIRNFQHYLPQIIHAFSCWSSGVVFIACASMHLALVLMQIAKYVFW